MSHVTTHLNLEIETENCRLPEDVRSRMQPALDRLDESLRGLLEDMLWLKIVFHSRSEMHHTQGKLKLPSKTIISGAHSQYLDESVLHCLDKIQKRVEHHRSHLDEDVLSEAQRYAELDESIILPADENAGKIGKAFEQRDYLAFRLALLGHEEPLRMRVGRWVQRYPKVDEQIGRSFEIADIVEEVFVLAFERYANRPEELSISEWLTSLIDPAVKALWYDDDDRQAASFAQTLFEKHIHSERDK